MRAFSGDRLLVATHNPGKFEEIAALLGPFGISAVPAGDHGLPEPEETGTTFVENARLKAHAAARATGLAALADDSGIEIDALDGAPGVRTADWAETPTGRDFARAMRKARDALRAKGASWPSPARFRAILVLAWPDGAEAVFSGAMDGHVIWPPRGAQGHGYDPMFRPAGHDLTFAEMDPRDKNRLSHRAAAFRELAAILG